ncbi:putative E3 ubiquitin-protein ligase RNF144A-B [Styela clava]
MEGNHEVIEVEVLEEESTGDNNNTGDVPSNPCKLCYEEITSGNRFTLEQCGCFFCNSCMQTYVDLLIQDGIALSISCPDSECVIQGSLEIHEVNTLIGEETFEKYLRMRYEQEVAVDPHRTFCPNPQCSSVCHVNPDRQKQQRSKKRKHGSRAQDTQMPVKVSCITCQLEFCHICKAEWPTSDTAIHKCNDLGLSGPGKNLTKLHIKTGFSKSRRADAIIKRCPVCNTLIEKDRGCAQMICKNCTHVFCWYCLKLLDNDFMLRHYDKGPCKNFLGHSRSQVMRHRLGVIGLFAAFTLLLIVASPILLLAAPIFLCCKWKDCCERAWRRAQQENNNALFAELEMGMRNPQHNRSSLQVVSEVKDERSIERNAEQLSSQAQSSLRFEDRKIPANSGNLDDISAQGDASRNSSVIESHGGASVSNTSERLDVASVSRKTEALDGANVSDKSETLDGGSVSHENEALDGANVPDESETLDDANVPNKTETLRYTKEPKGKSLQTNSCDGNASLVDTDVYHKMATSTSSQNNDNSI